MTRNGFYTIFFHKSGKRIKFNGKFIGFNVLRFPIFERHNHRETIPVSSIYRIVHNKKQF